MNRVHCDICGRWLRTETYLDNKKIPIFHCDNCILSESYRRRRFEEI